MLFALWSCWYVSKSRYKWHILLSPFQSTHSPSASASKRFPQNSWLQLYLLHRRRGCLPTHTHTIHHLIKFYLKNKNNVSMPSVSRSHISGGKNSTLWHTHTHTHTHTHLFLLLQQLFNKKILFHSSKRNELLFFNIFDIHFVYGLVLNCNGCMVNSCLILFFNICNNIWYILFIWYFVYGLVLNCNGCVVNSCLIRRSGLDTNEWTVSYSAFSSLSDHG